MRKIYCLLFLLLPWAACKEAPFPNLLHRTDARYSGAIAEKAMVVSAHTEATRIGVEVLKRGGNAIDAAVAVQFALAVAYPAAGNIGGGGFMVIRTRSGEIACLDFREKAPLKAYRDMYLDSLGNVITNLSLEGHLASGVPGTVDGMIVAHEKYGSLPFQELIQPAIDLAERGVHFISDVEPGKLNALQADFKRLNAAGACPFVKEGNWKAGDTLKQPQLARTLRFIRDKGRAGFYAGEIADSIVAEMQRGGGLISLEDLKNYQSVWRTPIISQYKDYRIISMPPPSSGGIALSQLLKMVENRPLAEWGFHTPQSVHLIAEAERRVYADRATHLGDPDFYTVPVATLMGKKYLAGRMEDFDLEKATPSEMVKPGDIPGMKLPATTKNKKAEKEETTHYSIVDAMGNAVSVTTTLNGSFGSKVVVKGAGFLLNNEMDDFSVKPGVPNVYGLVGAEANAISPAKRMLSSMSPTIIEKSGKPFMVLGSPGGSTIITSVFQVFLNVAEFEMSMQEAVNAGRFHHQWKPDTLFIEKNALTKICVQRLTKMGHRVVEREPIGRVDAILVRKDGTLEGAGDIRGEDTALGY